MPLLGERKVKTGIACRDRLRNQFRKQAREVGREGSREGGGGSRQRDSVSQRRTEAETAILRLEEEPVKSVISPGCVSRKQGRP